MSLVAQVLHVLSIGRNDSNTNASQKTIKQSALDKFSWSFCLQESCWLPPFPCLWRRWFIATQIMLSAKWRNVNSFIITPTKIFFREWVSLHLLNYVCFISSSKNVLDWQGSQRYLSFFNTQAAIVMRAPEPGRPETIVLHLVRKLSDRRRAHSNEECRSRPGDLRGRLAIAYSHLRALSVQSNMEKSHIKEGFP